MKRHAKKIGIVGIIVLIALAGFTDLLEFALEWAAGAGIIVDTIISLVFYIPIGFWLLMTDRLNGKIGKGTLAAFIVGLIPVLNALPDALFEAVMIIFVNNTAQIIALIATVAPVANKVLTAASFVAPEFAPELQAAKKVVKQAGNVAQKVDTELQKRNSLNNQQIAPEQSPEEGLRSITKPDNSGFINTVKNRSLNTNERYLANEAENPEILNLQKNPKASENTLDLQNRMQGAADNNINLKKAA